MVKIIKSIANKIVCGDCIEVMKGIPDKSIDLVVTDPPYNISQDGKSINRSKLDYAGFRRESNIRQDFGEWDKRTDEEFEKFTFEWCKLVDKVLKNKGWIYIFFAKEKIGLLERISKELKWKYRTVITWCKTNPTPSFRKMNWVSATEFIATFSKGQSRIKNFLTQKEMFNYIITPNKSSYGQTNHPTEKPLEVICRLIKASSKENDIILDPFLGSGTTALACSYLKRKYAGIEISRTYCEMARQRLRQKSLGI